MVRTKSAADKNSVVVPPITLVESAPTEPKTPRVKGIKKERVKKTEKTVDVVTLSPDLEKQDNVLDSTAVATSQLPQTDHVLVEHSSVVHNMKEFSAKLQLLTGLFSTVKNDYKTLEKLVAREMKNAQKITQRKRRTNGERKPSGFIKPTRISDELAEFLGKSVGTEMARTEVSREINAYIHSNFLQDKENGRKINPDAKLAKLLKLNSQDELTYFNLQRYMKHHFIKAEDPVVV